MLQRAASNAYSWWWASHIRTKQSKWMEQNLQDMEDKVQNMLKVIQEDGDSFAKRAEMYYKRRPELINFVEESYRAYRALAERYDHISKELQNANTTIASVFPDQVQFAMDEDDDDDDATPRFSKKPQAVSKSNIPNVPKMPTEDLKGKITIATKKLQPKKSMNISTIATHAKSGLSKPEAMEEIDKLQKDILSLQTEKEFMKSSYESGLAKYWDIEKYIKEKQDTICSLQDEFGTSMIIEDDEAQKLIAAAALKSCQEKLSQLQEKQERSVKEAKVERKRIKDSRERLDFLKDMFLGNEISQEKPSVKDESVRSVDELEILEQEEMDNTTQKIKELDSLREKIKEHFEVGVNASLSVTELADKIDELVNKVISLETAVSSQTALIQSLRTETDDLQAQIRTLEDDKVTLIDDKNDLSNKLREIEEKLLGLQDLNRTVEDQSENLQTHFTEACCNLGHLSEKLESVKPDEELEVTGSSFPEEKSLVEVKLQKEFEGGEGALDPKDGPEKQQSAKADEELKVSASPKKEESVTKVRFNDQEEKLDHGDDSDSEKVRDVKEEVREDVKGHDLSVTAQDQRGQDVSQSLVTDDYDRLSEKQQFSPKVDNREHIKKEDESQEQGTQKEDEPDWKQLFLNGMENKEKVLLTEYTTVLRNCKEFKKKFSEAETKLRSTNAMKDAEIHALRQKLKLLQIGIGDNSDLKEFKASDNQQDQSTVAETLTTQPTDEDDIRLMLIDHPQTISPIEEQFRMSMDELLEENLDFWLRFSTSFYQIQKFDSEVKDLQAEILKLEERKKIDGSSTAKYAVRSDVRPIYRHLREIHTELTVWLEKSALLKDELKSRFSSLCNIQDEITKALKVSAEDYDFKFTSYQAAKFQGEILNMKQENNKVAEELQAGLDHITTLQLEVEKTLAKLTEEFALSGSKNHSNIECQHSENPSQVPLRSFIFGVKPKKQRQSIFSCMHPSMYKKVRTS